MFSKLVKCQNWKTFEITAWRSQPKGRFKRKTASIGLMVEDGSRTTSIRMTALQAKRFVATLEEALRNIEVDEVMSK